MAPTVVYKVGARSASGYVDDYYVESDERSFICSKPGFVCAAAVLFTVSFIALAFFLEAGLKPPPKSPANQTEGKVAGAGFLLHKGKNVVEPVNASDEESKRHPKTPEVEDVTEQPRTPPPFVPTHRTISELTTKKPRDTLYIYAPFDDKLATQNRVIRFLMDALKFSANCFTNFTFQEAAQILQVDGSSESDEKNIHSCKNIDSEDFAKMREHFKNELRKNSKFLFVIRDPRSLIYHAFDKHSDQLENCKDNLSHRCLYNEEIMNDARKVVENWNKTATQMIEICEKLKRNTCRIILVERLIMRQTETLNDLANFLTMDENQDVHRMLKIMIQNVDDGVVDAKTPKEKEILNLISFLLTDTSNTWPWSGKLPFNVFTDLPEWAPLMGTLGYGFTADVPVMSKNFLANIPKKTD